jgi:hypothetical protein
MGGREGLRSGDFAEEAFDLFRLRRGLKRPDGPEGFFFAPIGR